jgi:hypothetical protein
MELLVERPGNIILLRIQEEFQWDPTVRLKTVLTNTLGIPLLVNTVRFSVNFFLHLNKYTSRNDKAIQTKCGIRQTITKKKCWLHRVTLK